MPLTDIVGGRVGEHKGGKFLLVERSFPDLDTGKLGEYIREHREKLLLRSIRKQFPDLGYIPKSKMLFLDIETCGFPFSSPIVSIALAHMTHKYEINLQCLFARNFAEEKNIIGYFQDLLPNYEALITYNGKAFDLSRLDNRIIQTGLYPGWSLKSRLEDTASHHDLFLIGRERKRINVGEARLKAIERYKFNFWRKDDIPSEQIPKAYYEYVYGREMLEKEIRVKMRIDPEAWEKCGSMAEKDLNISRDDTKFIETVTALYIQDKGDKVDYKPGDDLWNGCKEQIRRDYRIEPGNSRFKELAEALFFNRGGRIYKEPYPGQRIDEAAAREDMARIIHHNVLDTVSEVAILTYLCT